MLMAKQQGPNGGLQSCKPTILDLVPPPHNYLKSNLYPFDKSQSPGDWQCQAIVATPDPKDGNLQAPRYHGLSCDRQTQKYHVPSEHLVHQADVSKHGTSISRSQQNSYLQGGVNNAASGPRVSKYSSSTEAVPADRKSISEMPRTVRVPSPENPLGRWT